MINLRASEGVFDIKDGFGVYELCLFSLCLHDPRSKQVVARFGWRTTTVVLVELSCRVGHA